MDWFRRNWPDLLIGIALVAVIAGIIATLITGGSFFPVGQSTRTSTPPAQSSTTQSSAQPVTPASPSKTPSKATTQAAAGSGKSPAGPSSNGAKGAASSQSTSSTSTASSSSSSSGGVSVLPPGGNSSSSTAAASSSNSAPASAGAAGSSSSSAAAPAPASSPSTASAAPSTAAPSTASAVASGPGAAAPYRISVGAFTHPTYAQRQEGVFKKAGYPVFLAKQGDLTIVLVGPYRSQSEADSVASKIKSGGFGVDPVVYLFKGTHDSAPPPAPASASAASSNGTSSASASTASSSSTSTPSSATSGQQRYLQVGAYDSAALAKPQRDRMAKMGYTVTERTEGGLVKVLIGPFAAAKLQQVQSQLKAAGIDSFPR